MSKVKILYVEDEPFLGKIVKESLESRAFEVALVDDGSKALEVFKNTNPHICLLDVMLPNKDGFEVGQDIRKVNANIPIIFLTAKDQTKDVIKGFKSGGNDYLRKPFSVEELIVRIDNLLTLTKELASSNEPEAVKEMILGAYTFDRSTFKLTIDEHEKKLSHKETQLLTILWDHRNQPIDRRVILKEIWGDDHYFNSRNLDVYIRKLREYLKEDDSVQIVTLKGVGYQFVV